MAVKFPGLIDAVAVRRCQVLVTGYQGSMGETAVLVIDMLNSYRHKDAELLMSNVADIIGPLADVIVRAHDRADVDLIYINDNYGDFTANFGDVIAAALAGERPDLVKPIVPQPGCKLVTKVRHSAFFASALEYLLGRLQTRRLVLTGQVTEQCILYSALDGYVRHYSLVVPPDAVAHINRDLGNAALAMMRQNMSADLTPAASCLE